jgi:glycine cleavage system H protein
LKEISELNLPDDVRYAEDHEWARPEGDKAKIGINDYAQDQLGDIVFVELPQVGDTFKKDEEFGTVESVKAVSELYMPVGGEILAVNTVLEESPELVNESPYKDGWMLEVKPNNPDD